MTNQKQMLDILTQRLSAGKRGVFIFEAPTGSGKTAVEYTIAKAIEETQGGPVFIITPTKTLVEQIAQLHPDVKVAYGRHEHPCLYYEPKDVLTPEYVQSLYSNPENLKADEIPCLTLRDCPHRVNQETGETHEKGACPCPYYRQKYEAKQGGVVVSTTAFYLFTQLFSKEFPRPNVLVIDEAHQIARVVRSSLSYEITDYHLSRSIELLEKIEAHDIAKQLNAFYRKMIHIIKRKPSRQNTMLDDDELEELIGVLKGINTTALQAHIQQAIKQGKIDTKEHRETLKKIEELTHDIWRYLLSFELSLETEERNPLSYTYAYYKEEKEGQERAQYRLFIKAYYVAPLIRKILSPFTVAFSATIGDADIFGYESGIRGQYESFDSDFPVENTRIFLPSDTPNLAMRERKKGQPTRILREIAKTCKRFSKKGLRSLVVVVSNAELDKFKMLSEEESLDCLTYGNGVSPKAAALAFKEGAGDVLVGTQANYGEGVDLPKQIAPVIFFLRPGYPSPHAPATQFEEKRFRNMRWALWNWRVMMEALQVRGRNVRSGKDLGVTFFISQQFRRFVYASLPHWLQKAYVWDKTFDECVDETEKLLSGK